MNCVIKNKLTCTAIIIRIKMSFITKLLFFSFLQLIPVYLFSQKSYDIYADALYLSKFDEYKNLADSILDLEITNGAKKFEIYLLKSRLLYEKGQSSEGFPFLLKAVKYGCDFHHHIFTNNFFKKHITQSDSLEIVKYAQKDVEIPFQSANKLALTDLYELVNWDQALNWFLIKYHDSICLNQKQYRVFHNKMINELLIDYLTKFGYPNEQDFGSDLVDRFRIVIVHQKNVEWLKPFYNEAFKNNKMSLECYYEFYDWIQVERGLPQKYGAYNNGQIRNGKYYNFPIEDIKNIDSLRKSVNLSPLHVFLRNNSFEMPEGYSYDFNKYINSVRNRLRKQ